MKLASHAAEGVPPGRQRGAHRQTIHRGEPGSPPRRAVSREAGGLGAAGSPPRGPRTPASPAHCPRLQGRAAPSPVAR